LPPCRESRVLVCRERPRCAKGQFQRFAEHRHIGLPWPRPTHLPKIHARRGYTDTRCDFSDRQSTLYTCCSEDLTEARFASQLDLQQLTSVSPMVCGISSSVTLVNYRSCSSLPVLSRPETHSCSPWRMSTRRIPHELLSRFERVPDLHIEMQAELNGRRLRSSRIFPRI
jgi:hypothetical protein